MKTMYEIPEMEIVRLFAEDIIITSGSELTNGGYEGIEEELKWGVLK